MQRAVSAAIAVAAAGVCAAYPRTVHAADRPKRKRSNFGRASKISVTADCGVNAKLPEVKSSGEKERPLQTSDGFSRAELLEEALKKIGSTPLEEAIQVYPIETWRVWSSTYPRNYTEDSEEFPKRMEYLQKSAREVRTWNAKHRREPDEFLALNNTADNKVAPSVPGGLYPGKLPDHYELPAGLMVS